MILFIFQEVANQLAKLSVIACSCLGGYLSGELETPQNQLATNAYLSLLTPYLTKKLSSEKPEEVCYFFFQLFTMISTLNFL